MRKKMIRGLSLACLLAAPVALAAEAPAVPAAPAAPAADTGLDPVTFPRPAILAPNIAFWTQVFGDYSEYQSVIHYQDEPAKVYTVLDFRDDLAERGPVAARSAQQKAEKAVKRELDQHLRNIQAHKDHPEQLSPVEQKIYALFEGDPNPNRFKEAVGHFRAQRGLKEKTERALQVAGQYLPKMEAIFAAQGLPTALTRLPLVESSFNLDAYSKVGAAGLWQFIPSSARLYMRLDEAVDDRRDPWTSTEAAARHLKEDFAVLGNWPLAITAYNHGRAGLAKGLQETHGTSLEDLLANWDGRRFGFASRNFYAEFVAASDVEHAHRAQFGTIERHDPIEFEAVQIQHYVSYEALRRCAGISEDEFRTLNPGYRPEVLDGRLYVPPQTQIRVPVGKGQAFMAAYLALGDDERFTQQRFYYVRYRVQKGDTLGTIARRYGVGLSTLRESNGMSGKSLIRAGQVLRVPPRGHVIKVAAETDKAAPSSTTVLMHQVLPGQSLASIAHQYRTTITVLRRLNGLDESQLIQAGASIKVPSY